MVVRNLLGGMLVSCRWRMLQWAALVGFAYDTHHGDDQVEDCCSCMVDTLPDDGALRSRVQAQSLEKQTWFSGREMG